MSELIFFLIVFILGIVGTGVGIILLINGEELGLYLLFFAIVFGSLSGIEYFHNNKVEYCPTCHYEYRVIDDYDYCPRCNTKLTNKCSNCGKTLPDKFFDNATFPYCGAEIKPKVGEQPLSEGSSEQNAEKKNECPECHHSFEGMDYIKDICPFCGKKID